MDWGKVLESAIGTFTGGAIALASMWIKELIDRRKAAQVWFEQYYIAEGIDRLLSHVRMTHIQIGALRAARRVATEFKKKELDYGIEKSLKSEAHEAYPHEALVRLETLLDDYLISALIMSYVGQADTMKQVPPGLRSETALASALHHLRNLYAHLKTIRTELLKVKVKQKSDIKDVLNRPGIKQALSDLAKFNDEWEAKSTERDQLIAQGK